MTEKACDPRRDGMSLTPGMKILLMLLTVITAVSFYGTAYAAIPLAERTALLDLYASTNGAGWTRSDNWNGAEGTECTWYGVTCTGGANVTILNLQSNNLNGSIPASIGNFGSLAYLVLNSNRLNGAVPSQLGSLTTLIRLILNSNQLSGSIPSQLGNLTNLQYLYLDSNQLSGAIPAQLGNLAYLQNLYLNSNQLSGSIPSQLGSLTNLQRLYVSSNQLSGSIPAELGNLASLESLYLFGNQLNGPVPAELGNLTNLQYLYLNSNQLSGAIPVELGNLTNLKSLYLYGNQLSGAIPVELGNLASLQNLFLDHNQLSGSIPAELGNLTGLATLNLESNQLSGAVPSSLSNLAALSAGGLDLRWNALYTADASLKSFLDSKQALSDWVGTQTIAPTNLGVSGAADTSITLTWTPIAYTADAGGYEVYYSATSGGIYNLFETTAHKSAATSTVTGLVPGNTYYFKLRTKTDGHSHNTNTVYSEYSPEVSGITGPNIAVTDSVSPAGDFMVPFGSITEGNTSDQTVTVTNSGNADLVTGAIAGASPLAAPFSIIADDCSNLTVAPAGTCTVTVRFAPAAAGSYSDAFDIPSNDPGTPSVTISVSGDGLSSAGNNLPSAPALVSPANGQAGLGTTLEFKWKKVTDPDGDTVTYRLSYCTDQSFTGCTPVDVASSNKNYFAGLGLCGGFMIFGTVFAGTGRGRKGMLLLIVIVLLCTGGFLAACGGGGGGGGVGISPATPATDDMSYTVSGLTAGATYYWKVVADDGKGGTAESAVWSFTTQ